MPCAGRCGWMPYRTRSCTPLGTFFMMAPVTDGVPIGLMTGLFTICHTNPHGLAGGEGVHRFSCPAFPELQLNLQCCLHSQAHRSSPCPFSPDLCATGAQGRPPALDKFLPLSSGLHVWPVALTVSTTPHTRQPARRHTVLPETSYLSF